MFTPDCRTIHEWVSWTLEIQFAPTCTGGCYRAPEIRFAPTGTDGCYRALQIRFAPTGTSECYRTLQIRFAPTGTGESYHALQIRFAPTGTGGCYPIHGNPWKSMEITDIVHCVIFIAQYYVHNTTHVLQQT